MTKETYLDKPVPSILLIVIVSSNLILGLLALPLGFFLIGKIPLIGPIFIFSCAFLALLYTGLTLFALGTTKYYLDTSGIDIRFGIWHRFFAWSEFNGFERQKKVFVFNISSLGSTPCVRLKDALVLRQKNGKLIYLTPNDSYQMLEKIAGFIR